jgi:hypothetical protein
MREAISSMPFSNPAYPQYSIEQLRTFSYAGLAFPIFIVVMLLNYRSRFLEACAGESLGLFSSYQLHATWQAPYTSCSVEHFARAADSLPAVNEPVWYPCHAGSRRAQATSILFFAPRHPIG